MCTNVTLLQTLFLVKENAYHLIINKILEFKEMSFSRSTAVLNEMSTT